MIKKLRIYQISLIAVSMLCVGLLAFMGITAIQKSMTLNLSMQAKPSISCAIYINESLVFDNVTPQIADGVELTANTLKLNSTSVFGQAFNLKIENQNANAIYVTFSGATISGSTNYKTIIGTGNNNISDNLALSSAGTVTITMQQVVKVTTTPTNCTYTTDVSSGLISVSGSSYIPYGATLKQTFTSNTGYTSPPSINASMGGEVISNPNYTNDGLLTISNVTGDIVVNASCGAITYTVAYYSNDGNTLITSETHTYGQSKNLYSSTNLTPPSGKGFAGWATTSNGEVEYTDEASVINLATTNGATVTLYAVWKSLDPFTFHTYEGSVYTAPISQDGTAYKYYCEFGSYPQRYCETTPDTSSLTPTPVQYAYDNSVTFYADANDTNKYAQVGSSYYEFEPIRWVVLGVSDGVFSGSTPSAGTTLFNATNSNRLTLVDNRIKLDGTVQNKLLFLSELALDNEYFGYHQYDSATTEKCGDWKDVKCDVKRFLNDATGATGTTTHQATFATISGLGQYYDISSTHATGKCIQQTQIEKTSYGIKGYNKEWDYTDNGYYNMFLLGSNVNWTFDDEGIPVSISSEPDSYNIASYLSSQTRSKAYVTPFAVANGAYSTISGGATLNTLGSTYWWLRSGDGRSRGMVMYACSENSISGTNSSSGDIAVRPSFVLNLA